MQQYELVFDEQELEKAAAQFLEVSGNNRHFAFYGEMGAGKTTFIKALCSGLGTTDLVSSPTFTIINEYNTSEGGIIYHFDFYRILKAGELLDIGFYDYCRDDAYVFIEWPEKAEEIIPDDFIKTYLLVGNKNERRLSFEL